jgi:hypothetical protein
MIISVSYIPHNFSMYMVVMTENDVLLLVEFQDGEPRYLRIIMAQKVVDKCASRLVDKACFCFETTRI